MSRQIPPEGANRLGFLPNDRYRTIEEAKIVSMFHFAGWACDRDAPDGDAKTREALAEWIELGLGVRRHDQTCFFDPAEVLNFIKYMGLRSGHPFWQDRMVTTARQLVSDMPKGAVDVSVQLKRSFNTRLVAPDVPLRLRLPLPLETSQLTQLRVLPALRHASDRLSISRGRLEARLCTGGATQVCLEAGFWFRAEARQGGETDGSLDKSPYLRLRDGLIVVTPRIQALSDELASAADATWLQIRQFWDFCLDAIKQGAVHYELLDISAPLDNLIDAGWGDCQLVSALFSALCRAHGIPARILGGFYLYPHCPTNHYWAEAWIDGEGWAPFDFICWDLSAGGQDSVWRDVFFGRLDARLTNQCFPFDFTGAIGIPMPNGWHIVQGARNDGVTIDLLGLDGTPVYQDDIQVTLTPVTP